MRYLWGLRTTITAFLFGWDSAIYVSRREHTTASREDDRSDVLWDCDVLAIRVIHWKRNRRQTIEYMGSRFLHTQQPRKNIDTVERETGWSWRHFRMLHGRLHSAKHGGRSSSQYLQNFMRLNIVKGCVLHWSVKVLIRQGEKGWLKKKQKNSLKASQHDDRSQRFVTINRMFDNRWSLNFTVRFAVCGSPLRLFSCIPNFSHTSNQLHQSRLPL